MKTLIGNYPEKEPAFISKFRKHQGWWRTCVLNQEEGKYWDAKNKEYKTVCNRINSGESTYVNFLSYEIVHAVEHAVTTNKQTKSGMIDTDRLYNNLLSSQPLAFNFFGWLKSHKDIALEFIKTIRPDITEIEDIVFEYAPASTQDKSAFDIGFVVKSHSQRGFIGLECKYTDTFSFKNQKNHTIYGDEGDKNYIHYRALYDGNRNRFTADYFTYVRNPYFNQLFRNELLAVQLKSDFDFVVTGLFCHHDDLPTIEAGKQFLRLIGNGVDDFFVLTYADYFENIQKLNLSWQQRELVMMLWARYCGLELSQKLIKSI
jgi:hypothetical protein